MDIVDVLRSVGGWPDEVARQHFSCGEIADEIDRLRAEVASLKEEREILIEDSKRSSAAQLAAIKQWNIAGEQLFLADETLRSISSYVGQGRMDGVENLDYDDVEKRIKEGIAHICQVEESRRESLTQQLAAANAKIDALMLEYCPSEMTPEQVDNWAKHQQVVQVCPECDIAGCRHLRAALSNLNEDRENRG
jgi:hypothetical protein